MNEESPRTPVSVRGARGQLRIVPAVARVDRHDDSAPPWTVPDDHRYSLDRDGDPPPAAA